MNVDHENTIRALRDQAPLATRPWRCRLGIHLWEKYSMPVVQSRGLWTYVEQTRYCACCGKIDRYVLEKH